MVQVKLNHRSHSYSVKSTVGNLTFDKLIFGTVTVSKDRDPQLSFFFRVHSFSRLEVPNVVPRIFNYNNTKFHRKRIGTFCVMRERTDRQTFF